MCMTLTEISMHEAFFLWCERKPMFSPSLWSFSRYGHEEKYGVRRHVKQLTAKHSTQKPPELTGVENGNMFKMQSVAKRDKEKNITCLQRKNVTFEWNGGKSVHTQHGADHWAAPRRKTVEKLVCSDWGGLTEKLFESYAFFFPPFSS